MGSISSFVSSFLESESYSLYRKIFLAVGTAYALKTVTRGIWVAGRTLYTTCLAPKITFSKYGSWAIVTGASEGIGRGYALELARQGLNIVLISRSEEKLQKVAHEIKELYNREVRIVPVDFTHGQSVYDDIQAEISDLDIAVLVNNVGMAPLLPAVTGDMDEQRLRNIIEVNCQAMVQMTHLVLPKMVEKAAGIIVNVSSVAAYNPNPLLNVYSATKVFIQYFSDALRYEYKSKGIIIQAIYPGAVATRMIKMTTPRYSAPSPETYSRLAVASIGVQDNAVVYWHHIIQAFKIYLLPSAVQMWVLHRFWMAVRRKFMAINHE